MGTYEEWRNSYSKSLTGWKYLIGLVEFSVNSLYLYIRAQNINNLRCHRGCEHAHDCRTSSDLVSEGALSMNLDLEVMLLMRTHMNEQDQNGVSHDGPGDKRVTSGDATTNEGAVQLHGRHHRTHAVPSRVSTVFIIVAFKYFFSPTCICSETMRLGVPSKVCFVNFTSETSVAIALHMTNTIFVDRALIVARSRYGEYSI